MGRPKQFIDLLGRPALHHTLRAFENAPSISRIYAVGDEEKVSRLALEAGIRKYGGCARPCETRSLSTRSGLKLCGEHDETIVLVHDGSRCLVTMDLIERVVGAARGEVDGVIPTVPVSDTIKVAENGSVQKTLDRSKLHATQTPQAFRLGLLREIYASSEERLRGRDRRRFARGERRRAGRDRGGREDECKAHITRRPRARRGDPDVSR